MLKVKKSTRIFLAFVLTMAMVFSLATTVSANGVDGTTTWQAGYKTSSEMHINGYNLTPVKTMGISGSLWIEQVFLLEDLSSANSNPANCTFEIRSTNGTVLARGTAVTSTDTLTYGRCSISLRIPVTSGQKIQLYSSVYDSSTGYARRASVRYTYMLN